MADIEIDLTNQPNLAPRRAPLSEQIKLALLADAHAQRSHREIDAYLSEQRVFPVIREMVEALSDLPARPYERMAQRLSCMCGAQNDHQTVLGTGLSEILSKDCFFSGLSAEIRARAEHGVSMRTFKKGERLCARGQPADAVFIVMSGKIDQSGAIVPNGHVLGLNAVLQAPGTYQHDLVAFEDAKIAVLTKEQCISIIYENQLAELSGNDQKFFKYMKSNFPKLADEEIQLIGQISYFVSFNKGEYIAKKEQVLTSFYVILHVMDQQQVDAECIKANSSRVARLETESPEQKPNYIKEGQVIGASGVVLGKDEKRDWFCQGVVECLKVDQEELKKRSELFGKMVKILNE